jgi:hypothetical protein
MCWKVVLLILWSFEAVHNEQKKEKRKRKEREKKKKKKNLKKMTISHLMCHVFPLSQSVDVILSPNLHPILPL